MGAWPWPTTNALLHDAAKLSPCEEKLVTCDAIIGAVIDQARQAEQELGVEEMAGNVDTNGDNLNVPATKESELAATMAELETMLETSLKTTLERSLETTLETGGRAALKNRAAWFSAQNSARKVSKDCWSTWATVTAISLGREFNVPEATVETVEPMWKKPEKGPLKGCWMWVA